MPVPRLRLTLVILAGMVLPLILDGCTPLVPLPLSPDESSAIKGGRSAVVLVRFVGQDQKGDRLEPFGLRPTGDLQIAIGDFDSGGVPQYRRSRTLSTQAREEGWLTLVLPPGYNYLVYGKVPTDRSELKSLPRWRIEVPPGAPVIYAGTFHLSATTGYKFLEGRGIVDIDQAATTIENETGAAVQTARRDLPGLPPPLTRLAVLHTGPILLDVPPPVHPSE